MINTDGKSTYLDEVTSSMQRLVERFNVRAGAKIKSIDLALAETTFNQLIAGKAPYKGSLGGGNIVSLKSDKDDIGKILLAASAGNIRTKSGFGGIAKRDDKRIWIVVGVDSDDRDTDVESVKDLNDIDNTALIDGSGIMKQRIMTASDTVIEFKQSTVSSGPIKGVMDIPAADYQTCLVSGKNAARKEAKFQPEATFDLVIYILKDIIPNGGTEMPYTELKTVKVPVTTGGETYPLAIQDNGVLFKQGSDELKEDGKKYIANAIASQFSSVEKIEVIGGASQEGEPPFDNKKLALDRANRVASYLSGTDGSKEPLGYKATASKETEIQPKESTEDRKTWRKVILKITGQTRAAVTEKTEDKVYYAESTYKLDQAVIVQATYTITVEGNF
jgi:outer membrane protein OmpA-like peptidoglycan-associated protein